MTFKTGRYPAEGRLILNPTSYAAGGTDLGKVYTSFIANMAMDSESLTEHATGSSVVDSRLLGMNVSCMILMADLSTDLVGLLTNNINNGDTIEGFNGYNVGDILGSSQLSKLLIRPVTPAGTFDATKPVMYFPRGRVAGNPNFIWDRRLAHLNGATMAIYGHWDTTYNAPFLYGDSTLLSAIV